MKSKRVLLVDDSATMRQALAEMMREAGLEIVGQASGGEEAILMAKNLEPDIITMDVLMPGMDGLEATRAILKNQPARIVIVSAIGEKDQIDLSFQALAAGALEVLAKPHGSTQEEILESGKQLAKRVLEIANSNSSSSTLKGPDLGNAKTDKNLTVLGIVASTGGPPIVAGLLGSLHSPPPFPILIAQHIAPGFTEGFARWLRKVCPMEVIVTEGSLAVRPGVVYLPSDGQDFRFRDNAVHCTPSPGGACPSGDRLLRSIALDAGKQGAGMVLTGMGADGALGLKELQQAGGLTVIQSPDSCVVDGMPSAAANLGAANIEASPSRLSFLLLEWAGQEQRLGKLQTGRMGS